MGAWGEGPFENDDAADFIGDLLEIDDAATATALLGDALLAVTSADGYLQAPEASSGIAAAVVVGVAAGAEPPQGNARLPVWINNLGLEPTDLLTTEARRTFERVSEARDNEWHELWNESGLLDEVQSRLAPYRAAL